MRLYENEGKQFFAAGGIPVPVSFGTVRSLEDFEAHKADLTFPIIIKALVLTGGRGKAGGIRRCRNPVEAAETVRDLLGMTIRGYPVRSLFLEEEIIHSEALYAAVAMNPATYNNTLIVSASGGVDIETVAKNNPGQILQVEIPDNDTGLPASALEACVSFLGNFSTEAGKQKDMLRDILAKLYRLYQQADCKIAEINPLLLGSHGPVAADAKIVLDDNSLFRQSALLSELGVQQMRHDVMEPTQNEIRARNTGIPYVDLLPENHKKDPSKCYIGLVPGGAGYGIFSIDEVVNIGKRHFKDRIVPVNFMDSGGGPPRSKVAEMFHILMDNPLVDGIITSRFGGISSCDTFIRGLTDCLRSRLDGCRRMIPVYGRMVGTDLPGARDFLKMAREHFPEPMRYLHMEIGNRMIMADVIREGIAAIMKNRETGS